MDRLSSLSSVTSIPSSSLSKPLRLAVLGLGRAGAFHVDNLVAMANVRLAYIVDEDDNRLKAAKRTWNLGEDTAFLNAKDVSAVFADGSVDACVISTPTHSHEALIVSALESGKSVFVEKPVSVSAEGIARCYSLAETKAKTLFCAFNRRFDPSFREVYDSVRQGSIGSVQLVRTTSRDSCVPSLGYLASSGGIFHDSAVHDIDVVTWIAGELPSEVFVAATANIPEIAKMNDFDTVAITLKFTSGALGLIDMSRHASYGYDQRLEVLGSKGMVKTDNVRPTVTVMETSNGQNRVPMCHSFASRYSDAYRLETEHFLSAVRGSTRGVSVSGRMTLAVAKIAQACHESAHSGKPVRLEWREDEIPKEYALVIEGSEP